MDAESQARVLAAEGHPTVEDYSDDSSINWDDEPLDDVWDEQRVSKGTSIKLALIYEDNHLSSFYVHRFP